MMFGRKKQAKIRFEDIDFYEYNIVISFDTIAGKFTSYVKEMPDLQLSNDNWEDLYEATIEALQDVARKCIKEGAQLPLPTAFLVNDTMVNTDTSMRREDIDDALRIERMVPERFWDLYLECLNGLPMSKRVTEDEKREGCILTKEHYLPAYNMWNTDATT
jgi:hypothetical protein